ncbi:MAG: DNA-directed RNA polymerase subunit omega [Candidatus Omnitrophota bacterium]
MVKKQIYNESLIGAAGGSLYNLIILVSKRAMQLAQGEKPLVDKPSEKVLETAIREIAEGKICMKKQEKE